MKNLILTTFLTIFTFAKGEILEPITWKFSQEKTGEKTYVLRLKASIDKGWHLYGLEKINVAPVETRIIFTERNGCELVGEISPKTAPQKHFDPTFNADIFWFENEVVFTQKITAASDFSLKGEVDFMGCNNQTCLPRSTVEFTFSNNLTNDEPAEILPLTQFSPLEISTLQTGENDLWKPVVDELKAFGSEENSAAEKWWILILKGFLGGLLALLTPCVWPIIPMTVGFFLKRKGSKREAMLYGASIFVIYLALGVLLTLILGASALNALSTSAVFNLVIFAILVVFSISFFGGMNLNLPASWSTKLDAKAEKSGGVLGILLMAFTLAVVSFSCTGPIIGTLLVEVAGSGNLLSPALGLGGFALALALPFAGFAAFPQVMKKMPKSGSWMEEVKIVLGFLELAFALKFLSVADLAYGWRILDREIFLGLWIVIFAFLGFYFLGKIRFKQESAFGGLSVWKMFLALITFTFVIYLIPGLWGAKLSGVSAFLPPLSTQSFNLNEEKSGVHFSDFEEGMNFAKKEKMPVMLDFTGFGCVNCRKMEGAVFQDEKVKNLLKNFVVISLVVDDRTKLAQEMEVFENGKTKILRTVGEKNSYLQRHKFGANAQPFYVLLSEDGKPLAEAYSYDENVDKFIKFLQKVLKNYE